MHDTERKTAEDLLRKKDDELHQSTRIDQAVGGRHRPRNQHPTQYIGDNTRFLLDNFDLGEILHCYLRAEGVSDALAEWNRR